jgi:hypothetical protein
MDNSSTQALEDALRWQEYIARAGKTPERREVALERIKRLKACLEIRKGFLDGR